MAKNQEKSSDNTYQKSVKDLPIPRYYDDKINAYYLFDGTLLDIYQINTKDLINSSSDEIEYDSLKYAKLYRVYSDDTKLLALNFPCDTHSQQQYFLRRIEKSKNETHKRWLITQKRELEYLEKNNTAREYYIMLFADTKEQLDKNRKLLTASLGEGVTGLITSLDEVKKHQIMFKLTNKNSYAYRW